MEWERALGRTARVILPDSAYEFARRRYFAGRLAHGLEVFKRLPQKAGIATETLDQIIGAWGNREWATSRDFALACIRYASETKGDILECGSGLSSLLLGLTIRDRGGRVWSFEHTAQWAGRMTDALQKHRISNVSVCLTPLKDYGSYEWYSVPSTTLPPKFALVICDGPPGGVRGGRYGLVPVMRDFLASGCLILLDDVDRPAEAAVAEAWCREYGAALRIEGSGRRYGVLEMSEK